LVKKVDDILPDHIGWRLWRAADWWKREFVAGMVAAGHPWHAEARAAVLPHVAPAGTRQADIVARMGLSKQAVQQLIAELEADGILRRDPDPADGRGKVVRYTEAGLAAQRDAARVKRAIERRMRDRMGAADFDRLFDLLKAVGDG
jgi:DNA-binding MarR family transcriptional regulator